MKKRHAIAIIVLAIMLALTAVAARLTRQTEPVTTWTECRNDCLGNGYVGWASYGRICICIGGPPA